MPRPRPPHNNLLNQTGFCLARNDLPPRAAWETFKILTLAARAVWRRSPTLYETLEAELAGYGSVRYAASPMAKLANTYDDGFELEDGEEYNRAAPDTFHIPDRVKRESLEPGELVKLIFRIALVDEDGTESVEVERMWVEVKGKTGPLYRGLLDNDPYSTDGLQAGMEVFFEPQHVIQIYEA